jgi:hypothetical protein
MGPQKGRQSVEVGLFVGKRNQHIGLRIQPGTYYHTNFNLQS